jgi:ribosomal protein L24
MKGGSNPSANIASGDHCVVVSGTHAGKSGVVRDRNTSATGQVTITVEQADGVRFKTLARNLSTQPQYPTSGKLTSLESALGRKLTLRLCVPGDPFKSAQLA